MFKSRVIGINQVLFIVQILLAIFVYYIALGLFNHYYHQTILGGGRLDWERYGSVCAIMVFTLLFTMQSRSLQKKNLLHLSTYDAHDISLRRTFFVLLGELFFIFITRNDTVSRFFLVAFLPVLHLSLFFTHRYLPRFLANASFRGEREQRTLVCGSSQMLSRIKFWLDRKESLGLRTVGLLTDEADLKLADGLPVLGKIDDLEKVMVEENVAQVFFLEIPEPKKKAAHYYRLVEKHGARMLMVNDLEEIIGHSVVAVEDDGLHFIGIRQEPLENIFNRVMKRGMDITLSLWVVLFILPVACVVVKLMQWLQSKGPLLHIQDRAGMNNRNFRMLKFRTMHVNTEPITKQAEKNDPRVFPWGRALRRFSLDELPQFWNVLVGDMSVVGPRPHLQKHNSDFAQIMGHYQIRSFVKPGITGLAQVRGFRGEAKNKGELIARVVSDLHYIENWSLSQDILIVLRTAVQMIFPPRTAY